MADCGPKLAMIMLGARYVPMWGLAGSALTVTVPVAAGARQAASRITAAPGGRHRGQDGFELSAERSSIRVTTARCSGVSKEADSSASAYSSTPLMARLR